MATSRAVVPALVVLGGVLLAVATHVTPTPPPPPSIEEPGGPSRGPVTSSSLASADIAELRSLSLHGSSPQVRANALASLGRFPAEAGARAALVEALAPTRPREERLVAASVLGAGPPAWREELRAFVDDADPAIRDAARAARH